MNMMVLKWIYGPRRRSWKLETTLLLITTVLCLLLVMLVGLENKKLLKTPGKPGAKLEPQALPEQSRNLSHKCQRNISASNITGFSTLPENIKNFLFYQHCRHFPMLLNVPAKCGGPGNSADVFLLLVIKSSPPNYDRREVLRKTWASERLQSGMWIRTVFISGTTGNGLEKERINKLLEVENRKYQDIIQWDFHDSFYNLTLKQVLFLEWMERFCRHVPFLFNGDDDIFANTDNMVQYLKGLHHNNGSKHLFTGFLIQYMGPIRDPASKYYIPVQVQESNHYPPYCGGAGFLLSQFTSRIIYNMSQSITLHPIDDVYMGLCLEKAGLKPVSHMGMKSEGLHIPSKKLDMYNPCYYREILLVHRFLPHEIFLMWHEIHQNDLVCGRRGFNAQPEELVP